MGSILLGIFRVHAVRGIHLLTLRRPQRLHINSVGRGSGLQDKSPDTKHPPQKKQSRSIWHRYLYVGRTGTVLGPVSALLAYLAKRLPSLGPLFVFQDGTPLSRERLVAHLRKALAEIGLDTANYSGHSFRIGAASTAARTGFNDSFIQTLGRWKSLAFTTYIRTLVEDLVAASAILASPPRAHR
jgi:integrase